MSQRSASMSPVRRPSVILLSQTTAVPTLLLVDDDPAFCRVHQFALTEAGFGVETAHDGAAALSCATAIRPDVIVLDSHMPPGNGLDFVRAYRAASRTVPPIIAISGRHDPALFAALVGAAAYLRKPFSPAELVATARRVLAG